MQPQINISFDELLKAIKALTSAKLTQLKLEIDDELRSRKPTSDLKTLLLNGPVATKKELRAFKKNRKAINKWGKKLLL